MGGDLTRGCAALQQAGRGAGVQCLALDRREVAVDRVAHDRVRETQWAFGRQDTGAGEAVEGLAGLHGGEARERARVTQVGGCSEHRHHAREGHRVG